MRQFFVILGYFLPFWPTPSNKPENQNFEEMKKTFGDVTILNLCNKKHGHMIVGLLRYGVLTDIIFCHFRQFFVILSFCCFVPLLTPKIKIWKECKKTPGDIILLHMCTINQDHMHPWYMMYGSWDMKFNIQNYFVILGIFLSFYPLNSPKNKNIKNEKNPSRYHYFTQVYEKSWSSTILFQRCGTRQM